MCVCVYVHVCVCLCACVCVSMCMCVCVSRYLGYHTMCYSPTLLLLCTTFPLYMCVCVCVCACACTHAHVCAYFMGTLSLSLSLSLSGVVRCLHGICTGTSLFWTPLTQHESALIKGGVLISGKFLYTLLCSWDHRQCPDCGRCPHFKGIVKKNNKFRQSCVHIIM